MVMEGCKGLMEMCDAHGRSVQELGEVWHLSGSAICSHQGGVKVLGRCVSWWRGVMVTDDVRGCWKVWQLSGSVTTCSHQGGAKGIRNEDSRNSKEIQVVGSTLDLLEIS